jgi:hypothetical protein
LMVFTLIEEFPTNIHVSQFFLFSQHDATKFQHPDLSLFIQYYVWLRLLFTKR